jgi:hypothetical protein
MGRLGVVRRNLETLGCLVWCVLPIDAGAHALGSLLPLVQRPWRQTLVNIRVKRQSITFVGADGG